MTIFSEGSDVPNGSMMKSHLDENRMEAARLTSPSACMRAASASALLNPRAWSCSSLTSFGTTSEADDDEAEPALETLLSSTVAVGVDPGTPPACLTSVPAEDEEEELEESEKRAVGPVSFSLKNSSSSGPLLPSILNTLRPL